MHDVFRVAEMSRICMIFSLVKVRAEMPLLSLIFLSFIHVLSLRRVVTANEFI